MSSPETLEALQKALESGGLAAGLKFLNARVDHRFTAVYELRDGVMTNLAIHDKQGEVLPDALKAVPLGSSFCQFALQDGVFLIDDKRSDTRLEGHPYQGVINAYLGFPLSRGAGDLIGTFCHFDFPALAIPDVEYEYLARAARLLPGYIPRPAGAD